MNTIFLRHYCVAAWFFLLSLLLLLSWSVMAQPTTPPDLASNHQATVAQWAKWLLTQVDQHPLVTAAQAQQNAAKQQAVQLTLPLYNPSLVLSYDNDGQGDNYQIGISQTIDWWDKRANGQINGALLADQGQQIYQQQLLNQTALGLKSLVAWQAAKVHAQLSLDQEVQLEPLINWLDERQQAGDLGQLEVELAYLSLSQRLNETAQAQAQWQQADAQVMTHLAPQAGDIRPIPADFWSAMPLLSEASMRATSSHGSVHADLNGSGDVAEDIELLLDQHPQLALAKSHWQLLLQTAKLAEKQAKGDPTITVGGGQQDGAALLSIGLSVPLNFRNRFDSQVQSAYSEALSAAAQYQALRQQQFHAIKAAKAVLSQYQSRYQRWQQVMNKRIARSKTLLDKQWRSGELSTTAYLQGMQQRAEGLQAGIALRRGVETAQIDWLLQTGRLLQVLTDLAAAQLTQPSSISPSQPFVTITHDQE